ncbi:hypothetical protein [Pseudomonas sp. N040]|uniref:hypothetical protein n=1 Tax=Pseudomonas sp. N040 TaxID=2785325 RepID=UPI001E3E1901|nr:hypothetical protein [Pseudomonas sp. N040]
MITQDALLQLATERGQSSQVISKILEAIGAHPDLIDLPRIITGFLRVLLAAETNSPIRIGDCDPAVWREQCKWLIALRDDPSALSMLGEQFWFGHPAPVRNPVLNRGVTRFGFPYAALWFRPRNTELVLDYERLLAQILAATKLQLPDQLVTQRYAVFLDLRRLCELNSCSIPAELEISGTTEEFIVACQDFSPSESMSENAELFASMARLVRYHHGEIPPTRSGGGARGRNLSPDQPELTHPVSEDPLGFVFDDPDDPDQLPGYYNIFTEPSDSYDGELAPDELSPSAEMWVLDDNDCDRPYVADKLSQQGIEAHIVRGRQMPPFSYSQFSLLELRDLLFGASNLFELCQEELRFAKEPSRTQLRMESIVFLHIGLWLGQPTTQIVQMLRVDHADDCTEALVLVRGDPAAFSLIVRRPDLAGDTRLQPLREFRQHQTRILLPDLAGSARLVDILFTSFPRSSNQIFQFQTAELEAEAKAVLAMLGKGNSRFTLTKIRNYVFNQIVSDTHDIAVSSMLSGVRVPSAQTPCYYLQVDTNHLTNIYAQSLVRVLRKVYACCGLAYEPALIQTFQHGAVGANHCLLHETIAANVKALAGVLRKQPTGRLTDMLTWHNHYSLWVVQMFMFLTGCRAIRNPLRHVAEFDPMLCMGAMSDKDSDDRHMSRLICMPPMLKRQLEHYTEHCCAITKQLTGYLPQDDSDGRWSRGFFLIRGGGGIRREEIRPLTIRKQMELVVGYTPHPINSFRKFIRTELAERDCPAEVMAAFMGHWLRGEEPMDSFSSFCPSAYADCLNKWISRLLTKMGWSAISSPWSMK